MPTRPTPTRETPTRSTSSAGRTGRAASTATAGRPAAGKPTSRRPAARRANRGRGGSRGRSRRPAAPGARSRLLSFGAVIGLGLVVVLVATIVIAAGNAVSRIGHAAEAVGAGADGSSVTCPAAKPVQVGTVLVPEGPIAGYCQDRLVNAAHIINAARAQGIGTRTQAIGVMTAMGESSLVNIDHGDTAGPDSRGLFQQRANGAWGSYSDRMTPYIAATHFFDKLITLPNWKTLPPSQAAHEVQINADPDHYTKYWPAAEKVVAALQ